MAGISQVEAARKYGADSCCDLCYHLFQRQGAAGVPGAAKTKPHRLKPQSDSNGLAARNGPTGSSPGSDACGDPSGGGTGKARSTSHGSMKQEAAGHEFHPKRVKEMTMRCRTVLPVRPGLPAAPRPEGSAFGPFLSGPTRRPDRPAGACGPPTAGGGSEARAPAGPGWEAPP
jgi:hypothetical protein